MKSIISVTNLYKIFSSRNRKVIAVNDVSFDICKGEIFGLIGPNGAGKSTIFSILSTLSLPTKGTVKIDEYDVVLNDNKIRPIIGIVPQKISLYPDLTAVENLEYISKLYGLSKQMMNYRISYYLKLVNLYEHGNRLLGDFSGGMKQRLSIISAMIHDPRILYWDEPTVGLDPQTRQSLWSLAKKFNAEGKTIVFTTHYMEEAEQLCDRVAIINLGKLIALDTPHNLKAQNNSHSLEEVFMNLTKSEAEL